MGLGAVVLFAFLGATLLCGLVLGPRRVIPRAYVLALFLLPPNLTIAIPGPIPELDKFGTVSLPALLLVLASGRALRRLRFQAGDLLALLSFAAFLAANFRAHGLYPAASRGASLLVLFYGPYLAGRLWIEDGQDLRRLLRFLVVLALAYLPAMGLEFLLSPFLGRIYNPAHGLAQAERFGFFRPFVFFRHALELGHAMALVLGLSLALRWEGRGEGRREPAGTRWAPWLLGLGVLLSMSRGPVTGAALVLLAAFLLRRRSGLAANLLALAGTGLFLWMVWNGSAWRVVDWLGLGGGELEQSLAYRFLQVDVYSPYFRRESLLGYGQPPPRDFFVPIIDGLFLLAVLEGGLVSLGGLVAWLVVLVRRVGAGVAGLPAWAGRVLAMQLGWLLFSAWGDSFITPFHLFLAGGLVGLVGGGKPANESRGTGAGSPAGRRAGGSAPPPPAAPRPGGAP